jgi:hypothetical protein
LRQLQEKTVINDRRGCAGIFFVDPWPIALK